MTQKRLKPSNPHGTVLIFVKPNNMVSVEDKETSSSSSKWVSFFTKIQNHNVNSKTQGSLSAISHPPKTRRRRKGRILPQGEELSITFSWQSNQTHNNEV